MKIWLVSIFEQTPIDNIFSTRFVSIAEEAVARGHSVTFFASTFKHNTKEQRFNVSTTVQQSSNYRLRFLKSLAYKKNISFRRLWSHARFGNSAVKEMEKEQKPDIILMAFPPISLSYAVSAWARKNRVPLIIDVIDPWPDIFQRALHGLSLATAKPGLAYMRRKASKGFARASHISGISQEYVDWAKSLTGNGVSGTCFYPAADFEATQELVRKAKLQNMVKRKGLTVIYAGSLASSYDIECILGAAEILERRYKDRIHFYIAGTGPKKSLISSYLEKHDNLTYLGRLPKQELMSYYAISDLGTTQHVKGASQTVTYKLFDLLSAGLPILNSLESEMKQIIEDNKVGLFNEPGNAKQLAENIECFLDNPRLLQEYRNNGYDLTRKTGDTKTVYSAFVDLLETTGKKNTNT